MSVQVDLLFDSHKKYNRITEEVCATDPNLNEVFQDIFKVMIRHEQIEEDLVYPLYQDLINRLSNKVGPMENGLEEKYEFFMQARNQLFEDHRVFRRVLQDARVRIYRVEFLTAFEEMLNHIRLEEELVYPSIAALWKIVREGAPLYLDLGFTNSSE